MGGLEHMGRFRAIGASGGASGRFRAVAGTGVGARRPEPVGAGAGRPVPAPALFRPGSCLGPSLELVRLLAPVLEAVGRRDRSLEDQLRRALSSVVLNLAEGSHSRGKNKPARYQTLASGKEVRAALLLAEAYGDSDLNEVCLDKLDQVLATLYRLVHRR